MKQFICDVCGNTCDENHYTVTATYHNTTTALGSYHHNVYDCCSPECVETRLRMSLDKYATSDTIHFSKAIIDRGE